MDKDNNGRTEEFSFKISPRTRTEEIKNNEKKDYGIAIQKTAQMVPGTYVINVKVYEWNSVWNNSKNLCDCLTCQPINQPEWNY